MSGGSTLARAAALALVLAAPAPGPALALPGRLSAVRVDQLAVAGGRHQVAWVSALDAEGLPVAGLGARDFTVSEDGRSAAVLDLATFAARYRRTTWTLLVDPELLGSGPAGAIGPLLAGVGRQAGPQDRLRVVSLGRDGRVTEAAAADAAGLGASLGAAPGAPAETPLWDVLHREVRRAALAPAGEGRCLWLVTRGVDAGSAQGPVEVLAAARARGRRVPVCALLLASRARPGEADRLAALIERTGGVLVRVAAPQEVPAAAERLVVRTRGVYRLRFDLPLPAAAGSHRLAVEVRQAGLPVRGELDFDAAEVVGPAWWQAPGAWLLPLALLALAAAAFLALRPRRICRLVVQSGEEKGCSYDVYALPLSLGAAAGNDLTFPDGRVSRTHAQLESRARRVEIVDLNSENGTFVNGTRIQRRPLERGDRVSLGGAIELRYEGRG